MQWKTHKSINFYIPNTRCNYSSHKDPYTFTPVAFTLFLTHSKGFWGFCCIWPFDQSKLVEWCGSCCFCLPLYPHFGGGVTWPDFSVLNIDPEKIWYKSCNLLVNINNLWPLYLLGAMFNICWTWFCSVLNVKLYVVKLWQLNFSLIYGCVYVILCNMHTIFRTCSLSGMGTIT